MMIYDILLKIVTESWLVFGQMAPYLLFGFFAAGVLSVYVSSEWIEHHLAGRGWGPVLKASLFGVPLPLCSCGVIPVSALVYRHGASRAATTSFLLSTPQTGVDSIAITYALLGPVFAIFRPIAALLTGFIGGGLVQFFGEPNGTDTVDESESSKCTEDCCAVEPRQSALRRILSYGFLTLPRDIGLALLVGVFIAGVMAAIIPPDYLNAYIGGGVLSIVLLMAAGVPLYVCATASVPIAAGFLYMGASPGAALAFLIAGPATNAATFTTIWKVLGKSTSILYLITVAISAVTFGLILDWLIPAVEMALHQLGSHTHAHPENNWLSHVSAIALIAVLAFSYISKAKPRIGKDDLQQEKDATAASSHRQCLELQVMGMTCSHCAESVRRTLAKGTGVQSVEVDLKPGRAIVIGKELNSEQLVACGIEIGICGEGGCLNGDLKAYRVT